MTQATVTQLQPTLTMAEYIDSAGVYPPNGGGGEPPFLGEIDISAATAFLFGDLAEGQTLSINSNAPMFSLLGVNFGGNGSTNFELPNLEGAEMIGAGQGPGLADFYVGQTTGAASVTIGAAYVPTRLGGGGETISTYQPSVAVTYCINVYGIYPSSALSSGSIGVVTAFAGNFAPGGTMACDGQILQISQYSPLFSLIGTTYGGNGLTTFALPDLRGRDIVGAGNGYSLGEDVGAATITLTTANLPSGGSSPINVQQPGLVLNYYIATLGVFPSEPVDSGSSVAGTPYLGQVFAYAGNLQGPVGCLLCDGQLLPINQYQALFNLLGTTYGGDGITTFALPNLQGRTTLGLGGSGAEGQTQGVTQTTLTAADFTPPAVGALVATASDALQGGAGVLALASTPTGVTAPMTNGDLQSLTVKIANAQAGDVLGVGGNFALSTTGTAITTSNGGNFLVTYNSATATLLVANNAGVLNDAAQFEAAMALVGYQDAGTDTTTTGAHPVRTLDWTVNDGIQNSATATTTITIDRAPTLSPETVDVALPIGGVTTSTAAESVLAPAFANDLDGDALIVAAAGGAGVDGTLTLNANGSFSYRLTGLSVPSDRFTYTVSDGHGGTATQTLTFVAPAPVAPTIAAGGSVGDALGGTAVVLDPIIALTAAETGGTLASATVAVVGGTLADADTLAAITTGTDIVASYNATTETLTLTGVDTIADYRSVLDTVRFAAGTPGARTFDWAVNDGLLSSTTATSSATVTSVSGTAAYISSIFDELNANPVPATITDGQPLQLSIAQALNDTNALNEIVKPYTIVVSDSASAIQALTAAEIATLGVEGCVQIVANDVGANLSNLQTSALGLAGISLKRPLAGGTEQVLYYYPNGAVRTQDNYPSAGAIYETVQNFTSAGGLVSAKACNVNEQLVSVVYGSQISDDFTGDGRSDLLFQSTSGALASWQVDDVVVTGGGAIGNPGAGWTYQGSGDFYGNGDSDILWRNQQGQLAIWEMAGTAVVGGGTIGNPGGSWNVVATGDFNGDGYGDILFEDASGDFAIWEMNGTQVVGGGGVGNPGKGWNLQGLGDFNGDGKSDLLFENASGEIVTWEMNGASVIGGATLGTLGAGWVYKGVGNFAGLGDSDILFENTTTGQYATWDVANDAVSGGGNIGDPGPDWAFAGIEDTSSTGRSSVVFRDVLTGQYASWDMTDTAITGGGIIGNPGAAYALALGPPAAAPQPAPTLVFESASGSLADWTISNGAISGGGLLGNPGSGWSEVAVGDFWGDGQSDILFENAGQYAIWRTDGGVLDGGGGIGTLTGWTFKGLGDFDGDGTSDLLFANSTTGVFATWEMNGTSVIGGATLGVPGAGLTYMGSGDFTGTGTSDLLFQDTGGDYWLWDIANDAVISKTEIGSPGAGWALKAIGDLNGDGKADLVFENASGLYASWDMNGATVIGGGAIGTPGSAWVLEGVADLNPGGHASLVFEDVATGAVSTWEMNDTAIIGGGGLGTASGYSVVAAH